MDDQLTSSTNQTPQPDQPFLNPGQDIFAPATKEYKKVGREREYRRERHAYLKEHSPEYRERLRLSAIRTAENYKEFALTKRTKMWQTIIEDILSAINDSHTPVEEVARTLALYYKPTNVLPKQLPAEQRAEVETEQTA